MTSEHVVPLRDAGRPSAVDRPNWMIEESVSGKETVNPIRRKIAVVGDSFQGQNYNFIAANGRNFTVNGSVTFLNILAGQGFNVDIDKSFFIQGSSGTDFIISKLPEIVAYKPDYLVFCAGHNDINQGLSLDRMKSNFMTIINRLRSADITPILCLTGPHNTVQGSEYVTLEQARSMIVLLNCWKRDYAVSHGLLFWDWYTPMVDEVSGGYAAGMSYDLIHPGFKAAYRVAKQGLIDLASIIPPPTKELQSRAVDPTNLVSDGFFRNSGAKISSPITGAGPAGWSVHRYNGTVAGGMIVNSIVPAADGLGNWNRLSVAGATVEGTRAEEVGLSIPIFAGPTTYQSGDGLEAWLEIDVLANSPFNGVMLSIGDNDGAILLRQSTNGSHASGGETTGPTDAWSGILYCPKLTIAPYSGAGTQYLLVQVIVRWDASRNDFSGMIAARQSR
jgi:lysophospholipase L1-like esterase